MHKGNLKILREKAENPDMYNKLMGEQPNFEACDVLSETSTASPADAEVDEDDEIHRIFEQITDAEWSREYKARIPDIAKKAMTARTKESSPGNAAGKVNREARLKSFQ